MSVTGSGVGSPGTPPQMEADEQQKTAAVLFSKAALKIVADTLDISLLNMDQDLLRYQSPASRPVIPPLVSTRVARSYPSPSDSRWEEIYQHLLDLMPQDFRAFFEANQRLPKEQQNPDLNILNDTLKTTAESLLWLEDAAQPVEPNSLIASRMEDNVLMPYIAAKAFIQQSNTFLEAAHDYLETIGPNNPQFDTISNYTRQFQALSQEMENQLALLQQPETETLAKAKLSLTADKFSSLYDQYNRLYEAEDLTILGPLLQNATLTAQALSLEDSGEAALLIPLSIATLGIYRGDSSLGLFGPGISPLFESIVSSFAGGTEPQEQTGDLALFKKSAEILLALALILGSLAQRPEKSRKGEEGSSQAIDRQNLAYSLQLQILNDSRTLSAIADHAIKSLKLKKRFLPHASPLLTDALTLFFLLPATRGQSFHSIESLLQSQERALRSGIESASEWVSGLLEANLQSEPLQSLNVYLIQAGIALENGQMEQFVDHLIAAAELSGTTEERIIKDKNAFIEVSSNLQRAFFLGGDDLAKTGINVVA